MMGMRCLLQAAQVDARVPECLAWLAWAGLVWKERCRWQPRSELDPPCLNGGREVLWWGQGKLSTEPVEEAGTSGCRRWPGQPSRWDLVAL